MKITKKERKAKRSLIIQKARVQKIEDFLIENAAPTYCPARHHFTNNDDALLNITCREFFMPAGTIVTGTIYKIECFWLMVSGSMTMVEGDNTKEVAAPILLKNVVGTKNALYAHTDCLFYGFIPNPTNSRDLEEIINTFSAIDASELYDMPNNKQQMIYQRRIRSC